MSTRSIIARPAPEGADGFEGRYQHWDGYPTWTGKRLYDMVRELGIAATARRLIDEHPAGWSSAFPSETVDDAGKPVVTPPQCYCHDARGRRLHGGGSDDYLIKSTDHNTDTEWAYVLNERTGRMLVMMACRPHGRMYALHSDGFEGARGAYWYTIAAVDLDGEEPDWDAIEGTGNDTYDAVRDRHEAKCLLCKVEHDDWRAR